MLERVAVCVAVLCLAVAVQASDGPAPPAPPPPEKEAPKPSTVELRGMVADPDGKPVSGATVRILSAPPEEGGPSAPRAEPPEPTVVESGEDGSFHAPKLQGKTFGLRVEAEGFAPFTENDIPGGASLNVRLARGHPLVGTVLALRGGEPIPGATIRACDPDAEPFGDEACRKTESGEGGVFTLVDLPRGVVEIEVLARAHALERLSNVTVPVPEPDDGKRRALEIFLKPGGDLAGRVVDLEDGPVGDARVRLQPRDLQLRNLVRAGRSYPEERTDESGRFAFEGLPSGVAYTVRVSAEGFTSAEEGPVSVEPGASTSDLTIRLGSGATLKVRLLDADENPVSALDVELASGESPVRGRGRGRGRGMFGGGGPRVSEEQIESDGEGRFTVSKLLPGSYTVRLVPEDFAEVEKEDVRLREGGTINLGTIVVREGERITGIVTDDAMEPIEGAEVRALWPDEGRFRNRAVRSGPDGQYRIPGLGDEAVQIWASAEGHAAAERANVMPGEDGVDFALERTGSVIGRVILPDGQAPVAFQMQAHPEADDDLNQRGFGFRRRFMNDESNVFSDPAGNFRVDELKPGTYTLEATTGGMAPGKKTGIRVVSDGVTDAGVITLEPGLTLRGRVLNLGDDMPVAGAAVQVSLPSSFGFRFDQPALGETTVTGSDGLFLVEGIEPGAHTISVEHPDYSRADTRVEVAEDVDPPEVVVHLSQGGTVTGTVRDAGGQPVPNARIMLMQGRGGDLQWASTDADGTYAFERLAPATYNLSRFQEGGGGMFGGMGMKSATVEDGQTVVVDFDENPGVNLTGLVLRGDEPLPYATLFFMRSGGGPGFEIKSAQSEADGSYRIGLDSGGTYDVTVQTGGRGGFRGGSAVQLVVPDEPEVSLDVVLATAGIAGSVTDADGEPLAGARVQALIDPASGGTSTGSRVGSTDPAGTYVIEGLEPGIYNVTVTAAGFTSAERPGIEVGDSGLTSSVDFRLEPGHILRGRVVDPGGRGLGGAMVFVTQTSTGETFSRPTQTDVNGVFTATGPGEGTVDITAIAGGWAPARRTGIVPREGEETVIQVSLGGKVEVRVLGPDGQPLSGVQLRIRPLASSPGNLPALGPNLPRPTGPDGATTIDLLAPGPYEIFVPGPENPPRVQVGVDEGSTTPAVLTLP